MIGKFEQSDAVLPGGSSRLCLGSGENGYTAESSVKQVCILLSHYFHYQEDSIHPAEFDLWLKICCLCLRVNVEGYDENRINDNRFN